MNNIYMLSEIIVVNGFAVMTPGPALLLVTHASIKNSKQSGILTAIGVSMAAGFWALLAIFGISILHHNSNLFDKVVKIIGSIYLIWLGIQSWNQSKININFIHDTKNVKYGSFIRGLSISLLNPKIAIFFSTIFVLLIPKSATAGIEMTSVLIVIIEDIVWYSIVVTLFSNPFVRHRYERMQPVIERCMGIVFIAFGVRVLALIRR